MEDLPEKTLQNPEAVVGAGVAAVAGVVAEVAAGAGRRVAGVALPRALQMPTQITTKISSRLMRKIEIFTTEIWRVRKIYFTERQQKKKKNGGILIIISSNSIGSTLLSLCKKLFPLKLGKIVF